MNVFLSVAISPSYGATVQEIQEVRLAKAELAMWDKDFKRAFRLVRKNLHSDYFHAPTFRFMYRYLIEKEQIDRAIEIYYEAIRRLHGSALIHPVQKEEIDRLLKELKPPRPRAVGVYYETAETYRMISEIRPLDKRYQILALKYYGITSYYGYKKADSEYKMGIIKTGMKDYKNAVTHLVKAKGLFTDKNDLDPETEETLDYMIGSALILDGRYDSGLNLLRGVYSNSDSNASIKEYANIYLESLTSNNNFYTSFTLGTKYNSNIHLLTDNERKSFSSFKNSLITKGSWVLEKAIDFIFLSQQMRNFSVNVFAGGREEKPLKRTINERDYFTLSGLVVLKYDTFRKSNFRFNYGYYYTGFRGLRNGEYSKLSNIQTFSLQYLHWLKRSTLTFSIPYNVSNSVSEGENKELGLSVTYSPITNTKYLSPSLTMEYIRTDELQPLSKSDRWTLSGTNQITFNQRSSAIVSASLGIQKNDSSLEEAFKEITLAGNYNYIFKSWSGMSLTLFSNVERKQQKDGADYKTWIHGSRFIYTY